MAFNITYKIKTDGEITFYREVLRIHCISKGISLSERELYILAFFVSEGYNRISKDKLIETKIVKNENSLGNLLSKYRSLGFLKEIQFIEQLHPDISYPKDKLALLNVVIDDRT